MSLKQIIKITNYKNNFKSKITCNKSVLLGPCLNKYYFLENIASMLEFDMMCFSSLGNPAFAIVNQKLTASAK